MGVFSTFSRIVRQNKGASIFLLVELIFLFIGFFMAVFGGGAVSVSGFIIMVLTCACTWGFAVSHMYNPRQFEGIEGTLGCVSQQVEV